MNNRLKIFTRLDAQNNRIPGSSVKRLTMPRTGKWVEDVPANLCCFPYFQLSATPSDVTDDDFTLTITCDGVDVVVVNVTAEAATTSIDELVDLLNEKAGYLGDFSVSGSTIVFKLKQEVVTCAEEDLEFTVEPTA